MTPSERMLVRSMGLPVKGAFNSSSASHSRANFCASVIYVVVICRATSSRSAIAWVRSGPSAEPEAARLSHL
jgi:hypothetical protein